MTWVCPICEEILSSTIRAVRQALGDSQAQVPGWFVERMGRRSIGLSHILGQHPTHARRDALLRAIKDEADADNEKIVRLMKAGIVIPLGNPFE